MFRPTAAACSKASRLPLTSKKANKDFYKGTRTGNILVRRRIELKDRQGFPIDRNGRRLTKEVVEKGGESSWWNLRTGRIDERRITDFAVPPGLKDTKLKPYVHLSVKSPQAGEHFLPYGPRGFDGQYYANLLEKQRLGADRDGTAMTGQGPAGKKP